MSAEASRPEPQPTPVSQAFWDAARQERLVIQHCRRCHAFQHYPRDLCTGCWSDDLEYRESSGKGVIHTFSVVYRAPSRHFSDTPYAVGLIDLEEGVRMMGRISSPRLEDLRIGHRVEVRFERRGDMAVPYFESAD